MLTALQRNPVLIKTQKYIKRISIHKAYWKLFNDREWTMLTACNTITNTYARRDFEGWIKSLLLSVDLVQSVWFSWLYRILNTVQEKNQIGHLAYCYCQYWNLAKKNWGSDVEMFDILHRSWNLKPIFSQKWESVYMNWGFNPNPNPLTILTLVTVIRYTIINVYLVLKSWQVSIYTCRT